MAADRIILNTPRYRGEYELDIEQEPLTALEWRWVKKVSGYLPMTIADGFEGGDPDLFVAFAVVALYRAGRIQKTEALQVAEVLADAPVDGAAITFIGGAPDEDEDAEGEPGPAETPETEKPKPSIGGSSSTTLDPLAPIPLRTGTQG